MTEHVAVGWMTERSHYVCQHVNYPAVNLQVNQSVDMKSVHTLARVISSRIFCHITERKQITGEQKINTQKRLVALHIRLWLDNCHCSGLEYRNSFASRIHFNVSFKSK